MMNVLDGKMVNGRDHLVYVPAKLRKEALAPPDYARLNDKAERLPVGGTNDEVLWYARGKYRRLAEHSEGAAKKAWAAILKQLDSEDARREKAA